VTYRLSESADQDLLRHYAESAQRFGLAHADRYFDGLEATFEFLAQYPHAARERTDLSPPLRAHPYKAHVILFQIEDGGIVVVRLRHGHEDWQAPPAND
jgi:toxin ParE1/3/4